MNLVVLLLRYRNFLGQTTKRSFLTGDYVIAFKSLKKVSLEEADASTIRKILLHAHHHGASFSTYTLSTECLWHITAGLIIKKVAGHRSLMISDLWASVLN
jgi:hypothetical protein